MNFINVLKRIPAMIEKLLVTTVEQPPKKDRKRQNEIKRPEAISAIPERAGIRTSCLPLLIPKHPHTWKNENPSLSVTFRITVRSSTRAYDGSSEHWYAPAFPATSLSNTIGPGQKWQKYDARHGWSMFSLCHKYQPKPEIGVHFLITKHRKKHTMFPAIFIGGILLQYF